MKQLLLLVIWVCSFTGIAQIPLSQKMTTEERELMPWYQYPSVPGQDRMVSTPPPFPVRVPAEWEEIETLIVTYTSYRPTLREIIRHAQEVCHVIVITNNVNSTTNDLVNANIPLTNVTIQLAPYNTIWIRDYGPNTVYGNDVDSLVIVDWMYNRPRPNDDVIPSVIGQTLDYPVYSTTTAPDDLVHTGGNFTTDGNGMAFSSELILMENEVGNPYNVTAKTEAEIDEIMSNWMGIHTYVKMPVLPWDGIHHIDMHMTLLDEETLLVGAYPEGIADGPQIEANLQYVLNNYKSMFGTPFRVIRVPMPPDVDGSWPSYPGSSYWLAGDYRTYTNSIFLNSKILVPIYNHPSDAIALDTYRKALPGYEVIGIDCNDIIGASGALHCITKTVGVADPLRIAHQPLRDTIEALMNFPISAKVQHRSGIESVQAWFSSDSTSSPVVVDLIKSTLDSTLWEGSIPSVSTGGNTYQYYITATSASGKTSQKPMTAPEGFYTFYTPQNTTSTRAIDPIEEKLLFAYPNPASSLVAIPIQLPKASNIEIRLINVDGIVVRSIFKGWKSSGLQEVFFRTEGLPAGAYWIQMDTSNSVDIQKLIVR